MKYRFLLVVVLVVSFLKSLPFGAVLGMKKAVSH
jgi:hypothetical protein